MTKMHTYFPSVLVPVCITIYPSFSITLMLI